MKPYYQSSDGAITVYHARWEDVLAAGLIEPREVALVHADPPYGQREPTNRGERGRGRNRAAGGELHGGRLLRGSTNRALRVSNDFAPVVGDDRPFDPSPLLARAAVRAPPPRLSVVALVG